MPEGHRQFKANLPSVAPTLVGKPQGAKDKRLSIAECRRLMGAECGLSDAELEALRDQTYALADISITEFVQKEGNRKTRHTDEIGEAKAA